MPPSTTLWHLLHSVVTTKDGDRAGGLTDAERAEMAELEAALVRQAREAGAGLAAVDGGLDGGVPVRRRA